MVAAASQGQPECPVAQLCLFVHRSAMLVKPFLPEVWCSFRDSWGASFQTRELTRECWKTTPLQMLSCLGYVVFALVVHGKYFIACYPKSAENWSRGYFNLGQSAGELPTSRQFGLRRSQKKSSTGTGKMQMIPTRPCDALASSNVGSWFRTMHGNMGGSKLGTQNGLPWYMETRRNICGPLVV